MQLDDFRGLDTTPLSPEMVALAAGTLGVEPAALQAVAAVESAGRGFRNDGFLTMRREAHVMAAYGAESVGGDPNSYDRFLLDLHRNEHAALMASSYGMFQIMGFNHTACGCVTPRQLVERMVVSEAEQLGLLGAFVTFHKPILKALREKDWAGFAHRYNGPDYRRNAYDEKLASAYAQALGTEVRGKPPVLREGARGEWVEKLQDLLHGAVGNVLVDGDFGEQTGRAVRLYQQAMGLTVDGVVGPRTWTSLGVT